MIGTFLPILYLNLGFRCEFPAMFHYTVYCYIGIHYILLTHEIP